MFRDFKKYEIFEDGRIWSYASNKWLKPTVVTGGYTQIYLSDNNNVVKAYSVHRVIYEAVTGQPIPEGMQVNHINEDKSDNRFENLNLMTPKENCNWGTRNERVSSNQINDMEKSKQVAQYDLQGNLINIYPSIKEVQRQLGFADSNIIRCCKGGYKQAYGFIWRYVS